MNVPVCQIRMSQDKTIRDLAAEFSAAVMESLEREVEYAEQGFGRFSALEAPVIDALFPYIKAYDSCGKHVVCTAAVQSALSPDFDDHIYILHLPFGVQGMVKEIVARSIKPFTPLLNDSVLENVRQRAEFAVFRLLKPHLHKNPQCRNHDVCLLSKPVDPWPAALTAVWP